MVNVIIKTGITKDAKIKYVRGNVQLPNAVVCGSWYTADWGAWNGYEEVSLTPRQFKNRIGKKLPKEEFYSHMMNLAGKLPTIGKESAMVKFAKECPLRPLAAFHKAGVKHQHAGFVTSKYKSKEAYKGNLWMVTVWKQDETYNVGIFGATKRYTHVFDELYQLKYFWERFQNSKGLTKEAFTNFYMKCPTNPKFFSVKR